mgnify:CR=1 FL=1
MDVAILGASGYGGGELLRLLSLHPHVHIRHAVSETYSAKPVEAAFPSLAGRVALRFGGALSAEELGACGLVFLARDNGVAMRLAPDLLAQGCRVIDLSADFRFRDAAIYDQWYAGPHACPGIAREAVYGLPELHREAIRSARVVGNPGCYTTCSILALAPALRSDLIDPDTIVIDGKSGISGAGRSKFGLDYHFSEANESVTAYKAGGTHRHTPEIEQELAEVAGRPITVSFTPHLIPMTRGILATCYARLHQAVSAEDVRGLYRDFYRSEPFVHVSDGLPSSKHTLGSNMCHIGIAVDARTSRLTVVSAIDNLGKGMAGQAVQNMNVMAGFDETAGLEGAALWP